MQRNEAQGDRLLRGAGAVAAAGAAVAIGPTSGVGIALVVVGVVLAGTAVTGFCPMYRVFGISTCKLPGDG